MMIKRNEYRKKTQFGGSTLSALRMIGALLIGAGALLLLSYIGILKGLFFGKINAFLYGLGGAGSIGIPLLCIGAGVLLICISRRHTRIRYFLMILVFYFLALALLNTTGHIADVSFMDYLADYNLTKGVINGDSFSGMFSAAQAICTYYKTFGGALGVLLSYSLWYSLGSIITTVILAVFMVLLVILFIGLLPRKKRQNEDNTQQPNETVRQTTDKPSLGSRFLSLFADRGSKGSPSVQQNPATPVVQGRQLQPMGGYSQPIMPLQNQYPGMQPVNLGQNQMNSMPMMVYPTMNPYAMNQGQVMAIPDPNHPGQTIFVQSISPVMVPITPVQNAQLTPEPAAVQSVQVDIPTEGAAVPEINTSNDSNQWAPAPEEPEKADDRSPRSLTEEQLQESREIEASRQRTLEKMKMHGRTKKASKPVDSKPTAELPQDVSEKTEPTWYDDLATSSSSALNHPSFAPQVEQYQTFQSTPTSVAEPQTVYTPADTQSNGFSRLPERRTEAPTASQQKDRGSLSGNQNDPRPSYRSETRGMEHFHVNTDTYRKPSLELLREPQLFYRDYTAEDAENSARLERMFKGFRIAVKVHNVTHGPSVSRYDIKLMQSGVSITQITNKTGNVAIELATSGAVSIQDHILGTDMFGIYVPNSERRPVVLREILQTEKMLKNPTPTAVALGYDISGLPVICDLSKMPHLLVAGTTGSGKSVCMNAMIVSLLCRTTPKQVRIILIDPKFVEFSLYESVPHLLIPVITEPQKASGALMWCEGEMDDRYSLFKQAGVRNIDDYNKRLPPDQDPMPKIVIFIDEMADLMMTCAKDVEASIVRLGQKARAAGIHMVLATQRPDAKTVTTQITANVPARIALKVANATDSRIILGESGAEALLGNGDLIYHCTSNEPVRLQGCYVSDEEIQQVVDFLRSNNGDAEYNEGLAKTMEEAASIASAQKSDGDGQLDSRIEEAIEIVLDAGQASASFLQRRMGVGYPKAGKLMDDLSALGIIGPSNGSKPREVLITREQYEQNKQDLLGGKW